MASGDFFDASYGFEAALADPAFLAFGAFGITNYGVRNVICISADVMAQNRGVQSKMPDLFTFSGDASFDCD